MASNKKNKGEWSELYVLLKLLGERKLYGADKDLQKLEKVVYPILKIILQEANGGKEYIVNGKIKIVKASGELVAIIKTKEFLSKAKEFFKSIKQAKGASFSVESIQEFLKKIDYHAKGAPKTQKQDITLVIHDSRAGADPEVKFSIKSLVGKAPTLFNPSKPSNFVYRVTGPNVHRIKIEELNRPVNTEERIALLRRLGCDLQFITTGNSKKEKKPLFLNLQLIDSGLPQIIAQALLYAYSGDCDKTMSSILNMLETRNPLKYELKSTRPFYAYKIKRFLVVAALGMTAATPWNGKYLANAGFLFVKVDGDIVCYHVYNHNEFEDFLVKYTCLDTPSHERYDYGTFYKEDDEVRFKLNLQIRYNIQAVEKPIKK